MRNLFLLFVIIFSVLRVHVSAQDSASVEQKYVTVHGGKIRGDTTDKELSLVFTGHEFADGADTILSVLDKHNIKASFFFTGDFYRNENFQSIIERIVEKNHYIGAHSDKHLLYADWVKRDSTLVRKREFLQDFENNYFEMKRFGISKNDALFFMPPYEWYNFEISNWCKEIGITLINYTPGTYSNADYTIPSMGSRYRSSDFIYQKILEYEKADPHGLNGFILLLHIGTHPEREDKFYYKLDNLIRQLKEKGYWFVSVDELLG